MYLGTDTDENYRAHRDEWVDKAIDVNGIQTRGRGSRSADDVYLRYLLQEIDKRKAPPARATPRSPRTTAVVDYVAKSMIKTTKNAHAAGIPMAIDPDVKALIFDNGGEPALILFPWRMKRKEPFVTLTPRWADPACPYEVLNLFSGSKHVTGQLISMTIDAVKEGIWSAFSIDPDYHQEISEKLLSLWNKSRAQAVPLPEHSSAKRVAHQVRLDEWGLELVDPSQVRHSVVPDLWYGYGPTAFDPFSPKEAQDVDRSTYEVR